MMRRLCLVLVLAFGGEALAQGAPPAAADAEAPAETEPRARGTRTEALPLFEDKARAAELCAYDGGVWKCQGLERFNVVITNSVTAPPELEVAAAPVLREDDELVECIDAFELRLRHPTHKVTVDWTGVALTIDGRAYQAVPGFAREGEAGVAPRPSVAAAGTLLEETVHLPGGACIAKTQPDGAQHVIALSVPLLLDDEAVTVDTRSALAWTATTEKAAIALLEVPAVEDESGWPWIATTVGASVLPVLGVIAFGALVGVGVGPALQLPADPAVTVGSLVGVSAATTLLPALLAGGCCAFGGWCFLDRPAAERIDEARAHNRERAALLDKRTELGIAY